VSGSLADSPGRTPARHQLWLAGGVLAGVLGLVLGGRIALRLALIGRRRAARIARWLLLLTTLRLYQPCPDCHKYIHANARVCHRCGFRKRPRTISSEL
jgi:ribosomal protein L32